MNKNINYIDCKSIAESIKDDVKKDVYKIKTDLNIEPSLAVVVVGNNPASMTYIRGKEKDCNECGIKFKCFSFPESITEDELLFEIDELSIDDSIHGIIVQLPLPKHIDPNNVANRINIYKDVDGFGYTNMANLMHGTNYIPPCTPAGCIEVLDRIGFNLSGANVVVVGRSNIVGKPLAIMLTNRDANVTLCHSKTSHDDLVKYCLNANVIISATGRRDVVLPCMIPNDCIVLDVGINRDENGKLCGDIRNSDVDAMFLSKARYISPVPGGIGLMTRAMLLKNLIETIKTNLLD